jgi:hypothetical protein
MNIDYGIYIPSRGRVGRQFTLAQLPAELCKHVTLVVDAAEYEQYQQAHARKCTVAHPPPRCTGITKVREWIAATCTQPKLIMLDDDLRFYKRAVGSLYLRKLETDEYIEMFDMLAEWLDTVPHAAISAREGNNRVEQSYKYAGRALRCLAFRTEEYRRFAAAGRCAVMEDFDTALRLMRLGWANKISYTYAQNQDGGSNRAGGCSTYRTPAVQAHAAHALAKLHPGFVKVVTKQTKSAWQGQERTDVTVYWKKAWMSGLPEELQ